MYKSKDYRAAVGAYTEAITIEPNVATFYGNRAAANLMLQRYEEVIADSTKAVTLDPDYVKGYLRQSKALLALVCTA